MTYRPNDSTSFSDTVFSRFTSHFSRKRVAFTLAEVLITLGVIGVVASLTLSPFISKQQEKSTVVALEKAYSVLSQASKMAIAKDDEINNWCTGEPVNLQECSKIIADKFEKELKIVKKCKTTDKSCIPNKAKGWKPLYSEAYHMPTVQPLSLAYDDTILLTSDGMILMFMANFPDNDNSVWCPSGLRGSLATYWAAYYGYCGYIRVDINGLKGPNVYGKDLFEFKIYRDGIRATGLPIDHVWVDNFETRCLSDKSRATGSACSGWVLTNQNLDYLHCPDKLGWDKKKSCKEE